MDDELVPFLADVSGPSELDRRRRATWTLLTVILCAAMVLLGAGLLPLALAAPTELPPALVGTAPASGHSLVTPGS